MDVTGVQIVTRARLYIHTPFRSGGRNEFGLDCGGLIVRVAHDLGLTDFDVPNYHLSFDCGQVGAHLEPFCDRVDTLAELETYQGGGVKPGDFLLFSLAKGGQHLGIASGEGTFVHSWDSPSVREVTETPLDQWWQSRLLSVWRFRGLG